MLGQLGATAAQRIEIEAQVRSESLRAGYEHPAVPADAAAGLLMPLLVQLAAERDTAVLCASAETGLQRLMPFASVRCCSTQSSGSAAVSVQERIIFLCLSLRCRSLKKLSRPHQLSGVSQRLCASLFAPTNQLAAPFATAAWWASARVTGDYALTCPARRTAAHLAARPGSSGPVWVNSAS